MASKDGVPTWATVHKNNDMVNVKEEELKGLPTKEEEAYLRTRTYHSVAAHFDRVVEREMNASVASMVKDLQSLFSISRKRPRPSDDDCDDDEDNDEAIFGFETTTRPVFTSRVPLAILKGPYAPLDRRELMQCLVRNFRQSRAAICHVRNLGEMVSSCNHVGPILREILRQVRLLGLCKWLFIGSYLPTSL